MTVIDQILSRGIGRHNRRAIPRILSLANQKGGVGKNHHSDQIWVRHSLTIGERVLIVDLDPQGNASTGLGIDRATALLDL